MPVFVRFVILINKLLNYRYIAYLELDDGIVRVSHCEVVVDHHAL
jgi:hypothetical protein